MTFDEMRQLPEEELRKIAMEKNKVGIASKSALMAQKILYEALHWPCGSVTRRGYDRHGNIITRAGAFDGK